MFEKTMGFILSYIPISGKAYLTTDTGNVVEADYPHWDVQKYH